jgi:hypothetical protein
MKGRAQDAVNFSLYISFLKRELIALSKISIEPVHAQKIPWCHTTLYCFLCVGQPHLSTMKTIMLKTMRIWADFKYVKFQVSKYFYFVKSSTH